MGREIRRVPPDWVHPRNERGHHRPMHDSSHAVAAAEWDAELAAWEAGKRPDYFEEGEAFEDHHGKRPDSRDYMPSWPPETRTHYQMYEDTSEGTPISPVFATPEEVARYCADNNVSAFAGQTASYEAWLRIANGGFAPSMVVMQRPDGEGFSMDGVNALYLIDQANPEKPEPLDPPEPEAPDA